MLQEDHHAAPGIIDNAAEERFEMELDGSVAFVTYLRRGERLALIHTEVPEALRGRGAGERLVRGVLDRAREEGLVVVPTCPFIKAFLKRYPEYLPLTRPGRTSP